MQFLSLFFNILNRNKRRLDVYNIVELSMQLNSEQQGLFT